MTGQSLRRTIRRAVAVLLIPLSLIPWVFVARLKTNGYPYMNFILEITDEIAMIVFLSAIVYLAGSVAVQMKDVGANPGDDTPGTGGNDPDTGS